jgi:hypothetical protein
MAGQTRRTGSDDAVGYRAPIALAAKAGASGPKPLAVMLAEGRMIVLFRDRKSCSSCEMTGSIGPEASI